MRNTLFSKKNKTLQSTPFWCVLLSHSIKIKMDACSNIKLLQKMGKKSQNFLSDFNKFIPFITGLVILYQLSPKIW